MFSHNGMISEKQMRRILMLSVFSSSIFVLPYLFANMFGNAITLGVIAFIIMSALYVGIILKLAKTESVESAASCPNTAYNRIEVMVYIIRYIIRLVFYIALAVAILGEGQVPFVDKSAGNSLSNVLVAFPLLVVAYYGAGRNIEKQGRINEMIFWAAFFPYVVMMIFGLKEMDYEMLIPHGSMDLSLLLKSYALLTFIVPVEIYPQLKINSYKKDTSWILTYISVMLMIILVVTLSLVMGGIYGLNGMADEPMVSVAIMRYIELPLGVLQRFDVLMIWFFMTGIFAVLSGILFRIRKQLLKFFSKKKAEIILFVIVLAALFSCVRLPGYVATLDAFVVYGAFVDVPLSLLTMILQRSKKCISVLGLLCCVALLSGCMNNIENVEQRDYATLLMVSLPEEGEGYHYTIGIAKEHRVGEKGEAEDLFEVDADSITELMKEYGAYKGNDLSLSHLKVILTADNIGDDHSGSKNGDYKENDNKDGIDKEWDKPNSTAFARLLWELDNEEQVAKTCPVLLVPDVSLLAKYFKNAEEPIGTYISDLIKNAGRNDRDIPKLMDYIKLFREGKRLDAYEICVSDDYLYIEY